MQFIYPDFLFAFFVLAIPIIIHLFNFRRFKKLYFTNVRFLQEIKQDTKSRSQLKHLLVLLSRMLALSFLILAFAQPYFPSVQQNKTGATRKISIYIDNSFSMNAQGKNGALLEDAKQRAREIAMAYKVSDQFQLLTNDFEARHQRLINRDDFLQELEEVKPGSSVRNLREIVARQSDVLFSENDPDNAAPISFLLSDFQKSTSNLEEVKKDSLLNIRLIPISSTLVQNISIDTAYFNNPFIQLNASSELFVKLSNHGDEDVENIPLKLSVNGVQKALGTVLIPANSSTETTLSFTVTEGGWQDAKLSITDYPVVFDDDYYFSFNIRSNINVLSISQNQDDRYLQKLYSGEPYFVYNSVAASQVDYSAFSRHQLIILNEIDKISSGLASEIQQYVKRGGVLFIIPSPDSDLQTYNSLMSGLRINTFTSLDENPGSVGKLEAAHPLFSGVFETGKRLPENLDLPVTQKQFVLERKSNISETALLKLKNNNTFLALTPSGNGQVFTLCVSLRDDFSNFSRHALFVPVMLKSAMQGTSLIQAPSVIGRDVDFTVHQDTLITKDQVVHLVNKDLNFDVIPESKMIANNWVLSVRDHVKQAGNYRLLDSDRLLSIQSFNYERLESDLNCYSASDLESIISQSNLHGISLLDTESGRLTHTLTQLEEGTRLWKYFILLTLIFLAMETLLIRYFKPAKSKSPAI